MNQYSDEAVDRLPFSTEEKAQRYRTEDYRGAVGLNWYRTDPTLQAAMAYYLQPDELAFVEPHLDSIGELMGGPVARWAEQTDRAPARLERYDRWGHDVSQVIQPSSFIESKRAVLDAQKALKDDARRAGFTVDHSEAGLYLWVTRGEPCRDTVSWLAHRGILAAPGEFYGPRGARHVRVALTATDERIAAAVDRLGVG